LVAIQGKKFYEQIKSSEDCLFSAPTNFFENFKVHRSFTNWLADSFSGTFKIFTERLFILHRNILLFYDRWC